MICFSKCPWNLEAKRVEDLEHELEESVKELEGVRESSNEDWPAPGAVWGMLYVLLRSRQAGR